MPLSRLAHRLALFVLLLSVAAAPMRLPAAVAMPAPEASAAHCVHAAPGTDQGERRDTGCDRECCHHCGGACCASAHVTPALAVPLLEVALTSRPPLVAIGQHLFAGLDLPPPVRPPRPAA